MVDETNETEVEKNLNIVKLYYVNSNMLDNLPSQMSDLADYVKTININGDTCLLIGKFQRKVNGKDEYYFSHLTIQKG